ncbi:mitochondrial lysine-tRNA synthetase [Polyrhizophydium stewartii]|uniref:Lysine--tRNA ligase n=1 Tax=Polyrhizophydium stewartii TaxID=2732419 RepID=A0ABR4NGZ9_9FUNG|nr:hypothetical protein HK105_004325 [Polyrhizophydium stewartii]
MRPGAPSVAEFRALRQHQISGLGVPPYPLAAERSADSRWVSPAAFAAEFDGRFDNDQWSDSDVLGVAGRVVLRRNSGRNLVFFVLEREGAQIQVIMNRRHWPAHLGDSVFDGFSDAVGLGDVLYAEGVPGRSRSGQLSLRATRLQMLAPCLHRFPKKNSLFTDDNLRFRQRYLDMLTNEKTVETFKTRAKIIGGIRGFLDRRGFVEVETPILSAMAGGANAKPFKTRMEALDMDLDLRIAPELFLKQLVVGGLERVYEMGKQFRNEGIDATHNPEFTTCEFYMAYAALEDARGMTEELLRELAVAATGSTVVPLVSQNDDNDDSVHMIDFGKPFARIDIVPALTEALGVELPDLNDTASIPRLLELCEQHGIRVSKPHTLARVIDKLVSHLIEPRCIEPTFITGHPLSMSPLAKQGTRPGVADRFELFIGAREMANAYLELNDPAEQRRRFEAQASDRDQGDVEAQPMDEAFCVALEHGLPPTVGWGLGVDRVCMLLTQSKRIRDVIAFPVLRPSEQ